jgi:uncharacterized RDD family membrane protein YckC
MVTGFDILGHDRSLRVHWGYRITAFIADALMIFLPLPLLLYLFDVTDIFTVGLVLSVGFYLFNSMVETLTGASVGKKLVGLSVHPVAGESLGGRVCLRNLDRLFWFILPPLNFALGMAMRGDPRQTALDRLAGTVVVHAGETQKYESHVEALKEAEKKSSSAKRDACQECGGELVLLPDQKLQCGKCGLIQ